MPSAAEAMAGGGSQMQAALDAGLNELSQAQRVTFTQYTKVTLSPDSSVFWVATATTLTVSGSLHYATDLMQNEDETVAQNTVLLTSESEVTQFNFTNPQTLYIGYWPVGDGLTIQVAFSQRGMFYDPAELWHYVGVAVKPAMSSQIIANASDLPTGPIVSNSLPIFLTQNSFGPCYPSFAVPANVVPPYVVVHIEPNATEALAAFPLQTYTSTPLPGSTEVLYQFNSTQLMRDEIDLTLYGFTNLQAIQYLSSLIDYSLTGIFGFANSPAIRDAKRVQVEIGALAQKKTIHIVANYYQNAADVLARQLILSAALGTLNVFEYPQSTTSSAVNITTSAGEAVIIPAQNTAIIDTSAAIGTVVNANAHVSLSGGTVVSARPDGTLMYDDCTNLAFTTLPAWLNIAAAYAGSPAVALTQGEYTEPSWTLTPQQPIYLGPNGTVTQNVPTVQTAKFSLQLGVAITATTIYFDPGDPVILA